MIDIKITAPGDPVLLELIRQLDEELWRIYGAGEEKFAPFNRLPDDAIAVVLYQDGVAVGCGALRSMQLPGAGELKRMFVLPEMRSQGLGEQIVSALERVATTVGMRKMLLETGILQPAAIHLYEKCGFKRIAPYGPYADISESICMQKDLR